MSPVTLGDSDALSGFLTRRPPESEDSFVPTTIEQITHEALTLPEADRAHLAQTLLQSLEPAEESVEQAWVSEVGRRLERIHEGTAQGRSADEVFRDIRARLQQ